MTHDDDTMPPRFTGKWRGRHYYKGTLWLGPTNLIGAKPRGWVQSNAGAWGLTVTGGAHRVLAQADALKRALEAS